MVLRTYSASSYEELLLDGPEELERQSGDAKVQWLEISGLGESAVLGSIGKLYGLHPLSLEDTLDPTQRPKAEEYETYTFIVLRALEISERVESHQISLFLGDRFVVSVSSSDCTEFEPVRDRLRSARGKIRTRGADYLAYALVDAVVDHYFPVLESFDDYLEEVEDEVLEGSGMDPIGLARSAREIYRQSDIRSGRHAMSWLRSIAKKRSTSPRKLACTFATATTMSFSFKRWWSLRARSQRACWRPIFPRSACERTK